MTKLGPTALRELRAVEIMHVFRRYADMPATASEVLDDVARRVGYPTRATIVKDLDRLVAEGKLTRIVGTGPRGVDCFRIAEDGDA